MILIGDALTRLKGLPDQSVNCCVTSPPYWGLRDYGVAGQLGLEETPADFVRHMVDVFRAVKRVLRDDGTLWLNMGDSYVGGGRGGNLGKATSTLEGSQSSQVASMIKRRRVDVATPSGLKDKELVGMPWRLAFALQADGWYLRQDIIWHKSNPMPESVRDRCTKAHEYMFLLTKAPRYYFDGDSIREPIAATSIQRMGRNSAGSERAHGGTKRNGPMKPVLRGSHGTMGHDGNGMRMHEKWNNPLGRNKRSVWKVSSHPFKEAHFATFPPKLIEPCILAGCPIGGTVLDPFFGAGTTGLVATRLGRHYIGIELNPAYAAIAEKRIRGTQMDMAIAQGVANG